MAYSSVHRGARISPTKVRPVMNLIRGMPIDQADTILRMSKTRAAVLIRQALRAAQENARHVGELGSDDMRKLVVTDARVDQGPTQHRWREKDRGRAHPFKNRTSHITVAVDVS